MREGARRYSKTLWDVMVLTGYRVVGAIPNTWTLQTSKVHRGKQWTHWDGTGLSHAKKCGWACGQLTNCQENISDSKAFLGGTQG